MGKSLVPVGGKSVANIIAALSDLAAADRRVELGAEQRRRAYASIVFAYWAKRLGHDRALFDPKREARLVARLVENNDDISELLYVVDGARRDDYLMGRENGGLKHDGIETLFRDRGQVERLAELCPGYRSNTPHPMALKYQLVTEEVSGDQPDLS